MFHALADATRRDIVAAILERAGLVVKHRRGREQRVRGVPGALREVHGLLDQLEFFWRARIDRIDEILAEGDSS